MPMADAPYVKTVDYTDLQASFDIAESFRNNGFAVLKNHPIDQSLLNDVLSEWKIFFCKSEKHKEQHRYNQDNFIGHYPMGIENAKDSYEKNMT